MSEQITPERQAEAEAIGHAAYQAMRAEMIEAARQREGDGIDTPLLMEGLEAEAAYQAAREALTNARAERQRVLYAMWRANKDPRAVAALMPATVKAATVRAAVVKLAPSQDFEALPLWRTEDEEAAAKH
ncbi:hypothetical protein AB0937_38400 [Streptomyces sp. NPDC047880]|jgi:hypothetical protein|uniref:hypothetical protein n=1 Tax=Streptomyces TaxID=1883 RepID=UPI0013C02A92|nr:MULTISPECIES: hypothetical protein [Streptomyces]NEB62005.1 hypothetical protein [Streptomyces diastaticus]NEC30026.1 hypothetical protein [Streptomyces sp. SID8111]WUB58819.1 hypothetical protein OG942_44075 [Streptomyces griseorubiginosus]